MGGTKRLGVNWDESSVPFSCHSRGKQIKPKPKPKPTVLTNLLLATAYITTDRSNTISRESMQLTKTLETKLLVFQEERD